MPERLPVSLLTGFLGSGKTTLLARLLTDPAMGETAVIVNELGEAAIDHHLLRRVDERTVVLASGCVCCTMRGDLADELRDLLDRRARGEVPPFTRVAVETTGLADPAPIVKTLVSEPVISNHFRLDGVITTVDALNGLGQLEREPESVRQAAAADRLVITKTDVADEADVRALEHRLHALNPLATVLEVSFGEISPDDVLGSSGRDPLGLSLEEDVHTNGVRAFSLVLDEPLDWTAFGVWLTMLLQARGADVLRVKGLLDVGASGPVVLNAVQHVVHPPLHLEEWPDEDRRSRLVVIARGLAAGELERSMLAFSRAGGRPDAPVGSTPRA